MAIVRCEKIYHITLDELEFNALRDIPNEISQSRDINIERIGPIQKDLLIGIVFALDKSNCK